MINIAISKKQLQILERLVYGQKTLAIRALYKMRNDKEYRSHLMGLGRVVAPLIKDQVVYVDDVGKLSRKLSRIISKIKYPRLTGGRYGKTK